MARRRREDNLPQPDQDLPNPEQEAHLRRFNIQLRETADYLREQGDPSFSAADLQRQTNLLTAGVDELMGYYPPGKDKESVIGPLVEGLVKANNELEPIKNELRSILGLEALK